MSRQGFTPASVAGLQAWYDASAITGLVDGDPVASWPDASGNARTLSQATSSKRPTYKTSVFGTLPAVRMDNVDDYLAHLGGSNWITGTTLTAFFVWKNNTQTAGNTGVASLVAAADTFDYNSATSVLLGYASASPATATQDYRAGSKSTASVAPGSTAHQTTHQFDGAVNVLRYDGAAQTSVASTGSFAARNLYVGCRYDSGPANFNGKNYGEALIFNTAVSAPDVLAVEAYLKAKWGTP